MIALPVALVIGAFWERLRLPLVIVAGVIGLMVGIEFADRNSPMPTVLAATRVWTGYLAILSTAAIGALVFGRMTGPHVPRAKGRLYKRMLFAPFGVLAILLTLYIVMTPERSQPYNDIPTDAYQVNVIADSVAHPWGLAFLPGGDIIFTERPGRLRRISRGALLEAPIEGVPDVYEGTKSQGGLMDVELSPYFEQDRLVYFSYSCGDDRENSLCVGRGALRDHSLTDHDPGKILRISAGR